MPFSIKTLLSRLFTPVLVGALVANPSIAGEAPDSRTVLGPRNANLASGADALKGGDIEEGVRLSLLGLKSAHGSREQTAALSNLCAGYMLLGQFDVSLGYCDRAIAVNDRNWRAYNNRALVYLELKRFDEAEADVTRGQELAPKSKSLKVVKGMLLDETHPVSPNIIIDDRREPADDES